MPADVDNAFDIAFWFADTALNENEYLQPQKLQQLLFIAQAYYCVAYNGRKLMPAVFVADERGPIEPETTAYKQAFKRGHKAEITLDAMHLSFARAEQTPGVQQVVKPKMLRTQSGKPVTVKAWVPGTKPAFKK
ncbi:MAG: hypothetical protein HYS64_07120 [Rhodospirillales bacterium]|nr:hypothetical protein [Rhodospirillales bacterium]